MAVSGRCQVAVSGCWGNVSTSVFLRRMCESHVQRFRFCWAVGTGRSFLYACYAFPLELPCPVPARSLPMVPPSERSRRILRLRSSYSIWLRGKRWFMSRRYSLQSFGGSWRSDNSIHDRNGNDIPSSASRLAVKRAVKAKEERFCQFLSARSESEEI